MILSSRISMNVLLITPPFTHIGSPYPATTYLTGFLRSQGVAVYQMDLSVGLLLDLFSESGLMSIHKILLKTFGRATKKKIPEPVAVFLENYEKYLRAVGPAVAFLQEKDPKLALQLSRREFFPPNMRAMGVEGYEKSIALTKLEGLIGLKALKQFQKTAYFSQGEPLDFIFGALGQYDQARYFSSLFLENVARVIEFGLDPFFKLDGYAKEFAEFPSFTPIREQLEEGTSFVEEMLREKVRRAIKKHKPQIVGVSVPFSGTLFSAFRVAQFVKQIDKNITTVMGGVFVNTHLRPLNDPRVFDYFDSVCFDDGEMPLLQIIKHKQGKDSKEKLVRTLICEEGQVVLMSNPQIQDISHARKVCPDYAGIDLKQYLSFMILSHPAHTPWDLGQWNKMALAHGCYWKKCAFCDTQLDYVKRYDPDVINHIVNHIEGIIEQTGSRGFHFVDEAIPPALILSLAQRLIEKKIKITWWGNIRFEKAFTPEVIRVLAQSGCVGITGGLEAVCPRLLQLINKGMSLEQMARVMKNFSRAGVFVHAYLIYGVPTQSKQETVDALEYVRQLFKEKCLHSVYWHQFLLTRYSTISQYPEKFKIRILPQRTPNFMQYTLKYKEITPQNHSRYEASLKLATYNFMQGTGLDTPAQQWFKKIKMPKTKVSGHFIRRAIK